MHVAVFVDPADTPALDKAESCAHFLPLFLTIGITVLLVGLTTTHILTVAGGVITLLVLIRWVMDARREYNELPLEHHH